MHKVAVLGDRDSIYGFASVGLDIFTTTDDYSGNIRLIRKLVKDNYAVLYLTETLFEALGTWLKEEYGGFAIPAIIPIPGIAGNTGVGMERVKKSVERAIGVDIVFRDNTLGNR